MFFKIEGEEGSIHRIPLFVIRKLSLLKKINLQSKLLAMEKNHTFNFNFSRTIDVLTASEMSTIRGGGTISDVTILDVTISSDLNLLSSETTAAIGPISATLDDKRRDRPGGGISTH